MSTSQRSVVGLRSRTFGLSLLLVGALVVPALAFKPQDPPSRDQRQQAAAAQVVSRLEAVLSPQQLALIQEAFSSGLVAEWNARLGTPTRLRGAGLGQRIFSVRGKGLAAAGLGDYEGNAMAVLDRLSGFFRFKDVEKEFAPRWIEEDALRFHHVRAEQRHKGLRVVGGELIVHFDDHDEAYQVSGRYIADVEVDTAARIAADLAVAAAQQDLAGAGKPRGEVTEGPELVVYALEGEKRLAYELVLSYEDISSGQGRWRCFVDALTGAVLLRLDDIKRISAPTANGSATAITGSILTGEGGASASVTGWRENTGYYYLYNKTRYWFVYNVASSGYADNNTYAHRTTANWGTTDRAEMSGARNFDVVQDYYRTVHGRNSFNNGNAYARANVHQGVNYVNAYWDGTDFHFGDGDNVEASPLVVLDICGHEYTHAVTEYTCDLYYYSESGALNESFSDIFGACVEFYGQPDGRSLYPNRAAGQSDWLCGEDCWISSKALRDMRNPANASTVGTGNEQPSRYKGAYWYYGTGDNGGVHINSGVQNFFFYLLCEGGSGDNDGISYDVTGIGIGNAERVAYRALTVYCGQYTDYAAVRGAWVSAAQDLDPAWVASVEAAWAACGVGSSSSQVATPTFNPPASVCGSAVTVTISCATAGAEIRYTLNGNEPTETSTLYTAPLAIASDTTLKAKGFKTGLTSSSTASGTYSFLGTVIYSFPMDSSPGWTTEGQWAFGRPTGGGGEYGGPDPTSGHTGNNVYGYNLSGDYENSLPTRWLRTTALNLTGVTGAKLAYWRWLGVERPAYDHAYVEVSVNGSTWTRVWQNTAEITDSDWQQEVIDISSIADGRSTVYIRWGMGPTDSSWRYCGWNIDDVGIYGQASGMTPPAAPDSLLASADSSSSVHLMWRDNADNEQEFAIERRVGAGAWVEIARVGANVLTYDDGTVSPNTTCTYRIRARNIAGYSDYSNDSSTTTPAAPGDAWDPGDDTGAGATTLNTPSKTQQSHGPHALKSTDYYDWFRVYLTKGVKYTFDSKGGSGDTYAELFTGSNGSGRVAYNDNSGKKLQFSFSYKPKTTAWYYLRVRTKTLGANASYNLNYKRK